MIVYESQVKYIKVGEIPDYAGNSPEAIFNYILKETYFDPYQENFIVIALTTRNTIITHKIFTGGVNGIKIDLKPLFKWLLLNNAVSFIIAHNHPSGDITPSPEDIQTTKQIKQASRLLDLDLLDHIVFSQKDFTSIAREGYLR